MLKNSHDKVKKLFYLYFYVFEMQFIPIVGFKIINEGRLLVFPIILFFVAFCSIWHFLYEVKSLENIFDIATNINFLVVSFQILFTNAVVNIGLKPYHLRVQKYFENIVESSDEFISEARERLLSKNLQMAYLGTRGFFIFFSVAAQLFPVTGLIRTNYVSPNYYRIPGIPATNIFFYPVNIIIQFLLFWCVLVLYVGMDCLFVIYLLYFRGEMQSITAVVKLLTEKENLNSNCDRILRSIYGAHREILEEFSNFLPVLWHFYCHKLLAVSLLMCTCFFGYLQTNSLANGMIMQMMATSLLVILCVPGQLIYNCSEELRETLYESLWYEMKPKDQRNFLMIFNGVHRSVKAETIGIEKISFSTMVQGIKTAIAYIAFIYAVLF
ncbi:hypothetical protein DMENIID0001_054570 [Sergentomyia squamirostris]